eukprot:CAMPEP_0202891212 /NCGR_PEP_ID=MMETSP1392-20130828/1327_1 /ASSEMBLY_ACC=CAM_ASM_000868 /TAXON_ID=225041 /ORGANISM="Chlamydomonas chlamydogama, Strain SAG 11-48b" /LENGTH=332 /DNA_ID=CAMNT_0049574897 /DNA_START=72 /DNA_END=1070 /DNA_ORIENTATION=+
MNRGNNPQTPGQQGPPQLQQAYGDEDSAASTQGTEDPLDKLLENYNFICHPELRLKLKQELRQWTLGLCLAKPWSRDMRFRLTLKPGPLDNKMSKYMQKMLIIPTHSQVCLFSKKLAWGWLRLQFMAGYQWSKHRPSLDYRISTKWGDTQRLKRKEVYDVGDNLRLRCNWNMFLDLPDVEGHLGADESGLDAVDVDFGRLDFEISQVDVVIKSPLKLGGQALGSSSGSSSSGTKALGSPAAATAAATPLKEDGKPGRSNRGGKGREAGQEAVSKEGGKAKGPKAGGSSSSGGKDGSGKLGASGDAAPQSPVVVQKNEIVLFGRWTFKVPGAF